MQATTLIFVVLIAALLVGLFASVVSEMQVQYNTTAYNSSDMAIFNNYSSTLTEMSNTIDNSTAAAKNINAQNTDIASAFGYVWGAFTAAISVLILLPHWAGTTITLLLSMIGIPITGGILEVVLTISISLTILLGLLYYLLKVK